MADGGVPRRGRARSKLLDAMMPTRLAGAFPEGVAVRRVGLAEAVAETRAFLADTLGEAGDGPAAGGAGNG